MIILQWPVEQILAQSWLVSYQSKYDWPNKFLLGCGLFATEQDIKKHLY